MKQTQQTVLLGVTGSIAAYKACELLRLFQKAGLRVKVVMTEHAQELVGAATFRALSGEPVAVDLFEDPGNPINHISLAEEADVVVVAPCTANVLNKIANGVADDLLTTTVLAATAPLVLAPAMNVNMLQSTPTQNSLKLLDASGITIVGPGEGYLACGAEDSGRMSSPEEIFAATMKVLVRRQSMTGKRVLITAGPTREYLDPVRFISSPSSGRTGYALAREAQERGADVTLVSGPTNMLCPPGVRFVSVVSAEQMLEAASEFFDKADLAVFSAAVADFRPAEKAAHKLKKGVDLPTVKMYECGSHENEGNAEGDSSQTKGSTSKQAGIAPTPIGEACTYELTLTVNPDVLATLAARRNASKSKTPYIVGFAAETEQVLENARAKLVSKGADLIIANNVSKPDLGFESSHNQVMLVDGVNSRQSEVMSKDDLARLILDTVLEKW